MKKLIIIVSHFFCIGIFAEELTTYVDTRIGTASNPSAPRAFIGEQRGNTQPTGVVPFGMVQWGPDTTNNHSGSYTYSDDKIIGLSLTHLSGPGCSNAGELSILPFDSEKYSKSIPKSFSHNNEKAQAGYYSVIFDDGILAEISSTERTGHGRFTFPKTATPSLSINVEKTGTWKKSGFIKTVGSKRLEGWVLGGNFCHQKRKYKTYFAIDFNQPLKFLGANDGISILKFEKGRLPLEMKVGLSYVSEKNAWLNLENENPDWDFEKTKSEAIDKWEQKLKTIRLSEESTFSQKRIFYTALYHSLLHPNIYSDVNGDYLGFDQKIHNTSESNLKNFYANFSGWDIYRTQIPLLAFLFPEITSEIIQSYILSGDQCGGLPKWANNNTETGIMAGDPGPLIIANSFAFGARNFDTQKALTLMKKGALIPKTACQGYEIRPGLKDYLKIGYVPRNLTGIFRLRDFSNTGQVYIGAASATLEYTTADFAISQFAKELGDKESFEHFYKTANNWQNLFDGETNLIRPRFRNGNWQRDITLDSYRGYTEGSAGQYTWTIPYAIKELIRNFKNDNLVMARLDEFFKELNAWSRIGHLWIGNQPGYSVPWLYHYMGRPDKTQDILERIFNETFKDGPDGLPGNDDLGSTSSWYVWSAIGLYPGIPGVGGFFISKPQYPQVVITLSNGHILELTSNTTLGHIQDLKYNGKPYSSLWIPYKELKWGGQFNFVVGQLPNLWGINNTETLPSYGDFKQP